MTSLFFVCSLTPLAVGCRQPGFGSNLSPRQSAEVSALAAEQIASQYSPAVDSTAGYQETATAFDVLSRHVGKLPEGAKLQLVILDTPEQFSMSLPDGHIYLAAGLVRIVADDPGEAAALVAHQIGHVAGNHDAINLANALGGDELISMLDQGKYQDVVNTQLQLQRLSYTTEQEYQADKTAVRLLEASGYDASNLSRLVARLANLPFAGEQGSWSNSHPVSKSRISRIKEAAATLSQ